MSGDEILTLEPLLEAVRLGVEGEGWELSGLQKTTSYHFEGRWEGDSTRSAYLFFHPADGEDPVSIDVYLDETSGGLKGNLALVLDGPDASEVPSVVEVMERLAGSGASHLAHGGRRPLTLRFRLSDVERRAGSAGSEIRFKAHLPAETIREGAAAVTESCRGITRSLRSLLEDAELRAMAGLDRDGTQELDAPPA